MENTLYRTRKISSLIMPENVKKFLVHELDRIFAIKKELNLWEII